MAAPAEEKQDEGVSQGHDDKFLCGVAVSVYQNSGTVFKELNENAKLKQICITL